MYKFLKHTVLFSFAAINGVAYAQDSPSLAANSSEGKAKLDTLNKNERYSYHFQTTMIGQHQENFSAPYSGKNSLLTDEKLRLSATSTLFLGARLWKGAEVFFNPELSGGRGISSTTGMAGFPNGETYRIGDPEPVISISRIFLRQTFDLNSEFSNIDGGQNIHKGYVSTNRLVLTFGKFSVADIFDANTYSHDPRNQFMNWATMSAGAWDYPANTRGYTYGFVAELIKPTWSLKGAVTMVPEVANGPYMDMNIGNAHSETVEFDKKITINKRNGIIRLIGYYTQADMGNYKEATTDTQYHLDVTQTRSYAHAKGGFVINAEQELSNSIGVFCRYSWNDGKNETWAFTEIDRSFNIGVQVKGTGWKRPADQFGAALLLDGLSKDHRAYLTAGGYGFIIGDGQLNYGLEHVIELYYSAKLFDNFWLSPDYQFVLNPAYNKDRGPVVNIVGIRGHIEF
ncbi:MAG: carbohydrate porin [Flavipsychrobacter sp.]|nr:carbohydrate porin [Flavipsychrobacter sp.]